MILNTVDWESIKSIVIVFLITISFLVLFMLFIIIAHKFTKNKKEVNSNKNYIEGELYRMIYEKTFYDIKNASIFLHISEEEVLIAIENMKKQGTIEEISENNYKIKSK